MLRPTLLLAAALFAACALPVSARPRVEISVIDRDEGDWLAPMRHRGQAWIAGTPGHGSMAALMVARSELEPLPEGIVCAALAVTNRPSLAAVTSTLRDNIRYMVNNVFVQIDRIKITIIIKEQLRQHLRIGTQRS